MNIVNAIAKVRFSSAKPQRVHLTKTRQAGVELLCMEPGQEIQTATGQWTYYVITGSAEVETNGQTQPLPMGQLATSEADESHTLRNVGEGRLLCMVFTV